MMYVARPRIVVWNGSSLWHPRGSGPRSAFVTPLNWLYFVAVPHVSTIERPVLVPIDVVSPPRSRALSAMSTPCQRLWRAGPKAVSHVRSGLGVTTDLGVWIVIG